MQTNIRKLKVDDIARIYPYMVTDFPDNERKPQKMIEDSIESGFMEGYALCQEEDVSVTDGSGIRGELLAYALFVKLGDVLLFDYLAVLPDYRESGLGSIFLEELRKYLTGYECVIGEVENPDYCTDPEEKKVMERRIRFYLKNGVRDTGASGQVYTVEYRFFELIGRKKHSPEEAMERIARFYHTYWPRQEDYDKHVVMHVSPGAR